MLLCVVVPSDTLTDFEKKGTEDTEWQWSSPFRNEYTFYFSNTHDNIFHLLLFIRHIFPTMLPSNTFWAINKGFKWSDLHLLESNQSGKQHDNNGWSSKKEKSTPHTNSPGFSGLFVQSNRVGRFWIQFYIDSVCFQAAATFISSFIETITDMICSLIMCITVKYIENLHICCNTNVVCQWPYKQPLSVNPPCTRWLYHLPDICKTISLFSRTCCHDR